MDDNFEIINRWHTIADNMTYEEIDDLKKALSVIIDILDEYEKLS